MEPTLPCDAQWQDKGGNGQKHEIPLKQQKKTSLLWRQSNRKAVEALSSEMFETWPDMSVSNLLQVPSALEGPSAIC